MSAEIIQFIPRLNHGREQTDFPHHLPLGRARHLVMGYPDDTTPREYMQPDWYEK